MHAEREKRPRHSPSSRWIHNSGGGYRATRAISYNAGQDACRRVVILPLREPTGRCVAGNEWRRLADSLCGLWHSTEGQAEEWVRRHASDFAAAALPPLVPVILNGGGEEVSGISDDWRVAFAVLTRSSDHVYLRSKHPIVSLSQIDRNLTLILPEEWTPCT